jgi:hypothetical protein
MIGLGLDFYYNQASVVLLVGLDVGYHSFWIGQGFYEIIVSYVQ